MAETLYRNNGHIKYVEIAYDPLVPAESRLTFGRNFDMPSPIGNFVWDFEVNAGNIKEMVAVGAFMAAVGNAFLQLRAGTKTTAQTQTTVQNALNALDTALGM